MSDTMKTQQESSVNRTMITILSEDPTRCKACGDWINGKAAITDGEDGRIESIKHPACLPGVAEKEHVLRGTVYCCSCGGTAHSGFLARSERRHRPRAFHTQCFHDNGDLDDLLGTFEAVNV